MIQHRPNPPNEDIGKKEKKERNEKWIIKATIYYTDRSSDIALTIPPRTG